MDSESSLERELPTQAGLQPPGLRQSCISQRALGTLGRGRATHWAHWGWQGPERDLMKATCLTQEGAEGGVVASQGDPMSQQQSCENSGSPSH